jgi:hypothetical protein
MLPVHPEHLGPSVRGLELPQFLSLLRNGPNAGSGDGRFGTTNNGRERRPTERPSAVPKGSLLGQCVDPSTVFPGLPRPSVRRNGSGMIASRIAHCASVRSRDIGGIGLFDRNSVGIDLPSVGRRLRAEGGASTAAPPSASNCHDPMKTMAVVVSV